MNHRTLLHLTCQVPPASRIPQPLLAQVITDRHRPPRTAVQGVGVWATGRGGRSVPGVSQSFAKFRENFGRGAASREIFPRNFSIFATHRSTSPLASQAHAVHTLEYTCTMYRISMERFIWPGPNMAPSWFMAPGHYKVDSDTVLTSNCHSPSVGPSPPQGLGSGEVKGYGGLLSNLGGFVIRMRILCTLHVS